MKGINGSQAKLTLFSPESRKLTKWLTYTALLTLFWKSQGLTQKAISKQLGISPAAVSKQVKRLKEKGLLVIPEKPKRLTATAGGGFVLPFDVRFRSLKWKLTHPVNIPYDGRQVNSGVETQIWKVKGSTIRQNIGKRQYSLEIECGYTEGNSMAEVVRRHDEEALNVYDWLAQHYPELAKESARFGYEVNRKGEITIPQMKEFAEKWLETHPRLDAGVFKIDDSLKNGGEFQIKLDNLLTKDDIEKLEARLGAIDGKLDTVGSVLERIAGILEKIAGIGGSEGGSLPVKPYDENGVDYR